MSTGTRTTPPSEGDFLQGGGEMGALMRSTDWSATPLGSTATWPQSLRSALSIRIGSRFPIAIYWGAELALLYNDAWSPILGSKHPVALGQGAREVWPEIWDTIGPLFEQVLTTGEAVYQEDSLLLMHRHGYTEECYFNFTFSPVRGEGGRVEGIFNAVIETTFASSPIAGPVPCVSWVSASRPPAPLRKRARSRLGASRRRRAMRPSARSTCSTKERRRRGWRPAREPMKPAPPPRGADLERVHRNELRLLKLVNTLLDFSRIEAGRVEAHYRSTDLSALTADLASTFRSLIEKAGLTLTVECPPLPEPGYVDRAMYEKIVLNLLSNAFKFTLEGSIRVSLEPGDGDVRLIVEDSGTGIPHAELPHVFERFNRVEGAKGRSYEGSGIGLALVHELVKLHGGTVSVESRVGQGSRFLVSLPFGKAHLAAEQLEVASAGPSSTLGVAPYLDEASQWVEAE